MLLSDTVHGPIVDPLAAVSVPDSTAFVASSVPDGKCSFLADKYAISSPPCQKDTRPGVTVTSSFFVWSTTVSPSFVTVVSMFPTPTP